MTDPYYPCMRVDFPRWEEEDPIGWILHAERYFRYHKITDASMMKIMARHLEGVPYSGLTDLNILMESFHGDNSKKDY